MARRRYYESYYWSYTPSRPRKVENGIQLKATRGAIGKQWWSKKWIESLERFTIATRLTRGRSYARGGQVVSVDTSSGEVHAKVQGSQPRPYNVTIQLAKFDDQQWNAVLALMAQQARFSAKLLCGEMPPDIEDLFSQASLSLFPSSKKDLATDCSCPDVANPCKHVAAVHYLLAERFDEDPFLILELRGQSKQQIIEALRSRRTSIETECNPEPLHQDDLPHMEENAPVEVQVENFWGIGEPRWDMAINVQSPPVECAALKLLGPSQFTLQGEKLEAILEQVYKAASQVARKKLVEITIDGHEDHLNSNDHDANEMASFS
ncbi:MAG TPA: SWIM zinc finger family protein [Candidatus Lokiarchaeia archaeon]|nr:SWIM zinc finger family protein [Candidatus Lokiarchaeia archaeon]